MSNQRFIKAFNELYITERNRYLVQYPNGGYGWMDAVTKEKHRPLSDFFLENHFKGEKTYGVFSGKIGSKFICFDVDIKNIAKQKHMTYRLVNTLVQDFQIRYDEIHVSYSGSKGYHVELFFDFCQNKHLQAFYRKVIDAMDVTQTEIELRPTPTQGVKLPLGIHQETKKRCWYVDTNTLEPIESSDHVTTIKRMNLERFLFIVYRDEGEQVVQDSIRVEKTLSVSQREQLDEIVTSSDLTGRTIKESYEYAEELLQLQQLKHKGSRHNSVLLLARYFNTNGQDKDLAIDMITSVIESTPPEFFNDNTSMDWKIKEIHRIVGIAYDHNYIFDGVSSQVEISRNEIIEVLKVKNLKEKILLLVMLVHSKRYAKYNGEFYMAYSVMNRMTKGNLNRAALKRYVNSLEEKGLVTTVLSNTVDTEISKLKGFVYKKANVYRVNLVPDEGSEKIIVHNSGKVELVDIAKQLLSDEEIKSLVTKSQYYKFFN